MKLNKHFHIFYLFFEHYYQFLNFMIITKSKGGFLNTISKCQMCYVSMSLWVKAYIYTYIHMHIDRQIDRQRYRYIEGFPGGSVVKNLPTNSGDECSVPILGRSSGEGNGNPLQYSCLDNSMDKGGWQATSHGVAKSQTRLSD